MKNVKQYRKKLIVIEADLFDGTLGSAQRISKWAGNPFGWTGNPDKLTIPTLEGEMTASKGDYIIKGVAGEFYPCKPDIFKKMYEEV